MSDTKVKKIFYPLYGIVEEGSKFQRKLPKDWDKYGYILELVKSRVARYNPKVFYDDNTPTKQWRWGSQYLVKILGEGDTITHEFEAIIIANQSNTTAGAAYRIANDVHKPLHFSFDDDEMQEG